MNDRENPQRLKRRLNTQKHFLNEEKQRKAEKSHYKRFIKENIKDQETSDELKSYSYY